MSPAAAELVHRRFVPPALAFLLGVAATLLAFETHERAGRAAAPAGRVLVEYPLPDSPYRRGTVVLNVHRVTAPDGADRDLAEAGPGRQWTITVAGTTYRGTPATGE